MVDLDVLRAGLGPAGDGLVVRLCEPDDLDAVVALVQRADVAGCGELDSGRDEVAGMLASPELDPRATVVGMDGEHARLFVWVERVDAKRETWLDVFAEPGADAALADAGLAHGLRAARSHAATASGPWTARTGCFATDVAMVSAVQRAGFTRARRFWRMRIDLARADVPPETPLPEGVTVRAVHDEDGRRRMHGVVMDAFRDHWNHVDRDYETWASSLAALGCDDPDGWWLLEVDGEPAAACLLDDSRAELGDGYVRTLGVTREHRGRGLAQALLTRAFRYYRDQGRAGVLLSVDSESPTGADHLYRKVGMLPVRVIDAWQQPAGD